MPDMSKLYALKRDLNRYYNLRDTLTKVVNQLTLVIEKIEPASSKISNYSLDGIAADQNIISDKKKELIAQKNELSQKILPEINSQIHKLRKEIEEEETLLASVGV